MMRASTLKTLMWREQILARKSFLINLLIFSLCTLMGLLVMLSFRVGNLREIKDTEARYMIEAMVFFYPQVSIFSCILSMVEAGTVKDELIAWKKFRRTTPVSPICFAAARYLMQLVVSVSACVVAFVYTAAMCLISGRTVTFRELKAVIVMAVAVSVISIILQLLVMVFHSLDKAGFALMVMFAVPWTIYVFQATPTQNAALPADLLSYCFDKLSGFFTLAVLLGIAAWCLGLFGMTALLKRREK